MKDKGISWVNTDVILQTRDCPEIIIYKLPLRTSLSSLDVFVPATVFGCALGSEYSYSCPIILIQFMPVTAEAPKFLHLSIMSLPGQLCRRNYRLPHSPFTAPLFLIVKMFRVLISFSRI